jgi:tRNA (guanine37-N1)-methyltransferase
MINFDIISIFPSVFERYFNASIIYRAQKKKLIRIKNYNLRDWAVDKRKTVDDRPYGGGPGMIMMAEPIFKAVKNIIKTNQKSKTKIILFSPKGKKFNQKMAQRFSKLDRLIMVCGRYEGVDERVAENLVDEEISIGDYVLTGGEIPAMIVVDAVTRLIPGVIAEESLKEESFSKSTNNKQQLTINFEYPQYTRPEILIVRGKNNRVKKINVPKILLNGDHKKIKEWRENRAIKSS